MRRLIWGFAGRTYHIVGNLMHWLICVGTKKKQEFSTKLWSRGPNGIAIFYLISVQIFSIFCLYQAILLWKFLINAMPEWIFVWKLAVISVSCKSLDYVTRYQTVIRSLGHQKPHINLHIKFNLNLVFGWSMNVYQNVKFNNKWANKTVYMSRPLLLTSGKCTYTVIVDF